MTVKQRIDAFNAGRDPERLKKKLGIMRDDAFSFLRGTCHLFYEDLNYAALPETPLIWCSGDLHLQNFGTYKGDNRLTYFDINDFDESCLAPAGWDLVRFLTSVIVAGHTEKLPGPAIDELQKAFLAGYATALQKGKAEYLEREAATGLIGDLLAKLKKRSRGEFLDSRTKLKNGKRILDVPGKHALGLLPGELAMLREFIDAFAAQQPQPGFFRLLDAARRIAGTGSLGLPRYVLLVKGRGGDDGNFLLDLKFHQRSSVMHGHPLPQPDFPSDAHRVAFVQSAVQAMDPALLTPVHMDNRWWLLRELMPTSDRLDIAEAHSDFGKFHELVGTLGRIVAWGNLRSAARRGSATPDELIAFGHSRHWQKPLLRLARTCAEKTEQQFAEFRMKA